MKVRPSPCWRLQIICLSLALAACCAIAGCARVAQPPDTLVYARGGEADQLDPIHTDIGESVKPIVNVFDTLIEYDEHTTERVPGLATRWETSEDGLRWTFHLREGVRFHDGTPFDADAVVFTFNRLIQDDHPDVHSSMIPYRPDYRDIVAVRAIDPHTVEFELARPSAVFEANLAMFPASIVSPTAVKQYGKRFGTHPIGTGPFRFSRWTRDQELVLEANEDYWGGPPSVQRVVFVPILESAVAARQLERGDVHMVDHLPPADLATMSHVPGVQVEEATGMNVAYLSMQNDKPPLDHPQVRQAIAHAIDKKRLIEVAYAGRATPAVNPVPRDMWAWNDQIHDRPHDVALARQLLAEAQAERGFELPLKLDLFVMGSARPYMQQPLETAVFIKESLREIGIEARIVVNEISQHFQRLSRGEHQLALAGWSSDNADPDNFLYALLDPDNINDSGGNNISRYRNPEVHRLLLAGKQELDRERREALYRQTQELIFADAPLVPLVHTNIAVAERSRVKDYVLHPTGLVRLRHVRLVDEKSAASP
ncbi:MAG: ABC transporter substrate-binding protein [Pirellulales bacterium]|nr:ABC transporter substrate-binding protein [Pirellulales bacterium]